MQAGKHSLYCRRNVLGARQETNALAVARIQGGMVKFIFYEPLVKL